MSNVLIIDPIATPSHESPTDREQHIQHIIDAALIRARIRHVPSATYRLQFKAEFRFYDARQIVSYLKALGITHAYASPYLAATAGSTHGYDIINPQVLNPEIGTTAEYEAWVNCLQEHGMEHLLDFVPNHMGVATDANPWWQDVLENGQASKYATFFDIDWQPLKSDLKNKVLLPVLGGQFGRVLEKQELKLQFEQGAFYISYHARRFPVAPRSYYRVLHPHLDHLTKQLGADSDSLAEYQSILTALHNLPTHDQVRADNRGEVEREQEVIKRRLRRLCDETPACQDHIQQQVQLLNGVPNEPRSFDALEELLREQPYRLSYWKVAADEINYRRFFDVNELAALCMESPEVFEKAHQFVLQLIAKGQLAGLRIDHADGLYDPAGYLRQLQIERIMQLAHEEHAACTRDMPEPLDWPTMEQEIRQRLQMQKLSPNLQPLYVVAEKILERNERLPADWSIAGTTGYDFLNDVNAVFVAGENEAAFKSIYARFIASKDSFEELAYNAKRLIMKVSMASEINVLGHQLDRISEYSRLTCDFTLNGLTSALREIIACFPVYRTYIDSDSVSDRDRGYIEQAVARAKRHNPATYHSVFDFIKSVLLLQGFERADEAEKAWRRKFVRKFQQFTGPVMAKSIEDTVFYRYHLLISLNEVGGDPKRFGINVGTFHQLNQLRQTQNPYGLLATSTHDTKRSEDVRARINVLSEIPTQWKDHVLRWARWNKRKKCKVDGELAPSRNDEYLLYQTLIGTWPEEEESHADYCERICNYMVKAIREAKQYTSWITPNEEYERALVEFVKAILCQEPKSAFLADFEPFVACISRAGYWKSLSQTLLKLTSPGVPDMYPGTEVWSLRLVDPDNRHPVPFTDLEKQLTEIKSQSEQLTDSRDEWLQQMIQSPIDGRIKQFIIAQTLNLRRTFPNLFTYGEYVPLEIICSQAQHFIAFARILEDKAVIVIVPRLLTTLTQNLGEWKLEKKVNDNARIKLPDVLHNRNWKNLFSQELYQIDDGFNLVQLFNKLPIVLLESI